VHSWSATAVSCPAAWVSPERILQSLSTFSARQHTSLRAPWEQTASVPRHFLIQNPYHEYAARFIEHFHRKYGYRAVCLYSDRRERIRHEARFPILRSDRVVASHVVPPTRLPDFAQLVRGRYDAAAVVPFNEPTVVPAAELAAHLGLSWGQPQVLRRFRDKFALKEHLRSHHPQICVNASRLVHTTDDVLAARRGVYARFVLKPNDGFGNRHIAFFDEETPRLEIASYLHTMRGTQVLMEEFVGGVEYFINGQVDAHGEATVVGIFEYRRTAANGRHNIDFETALLAHRDPLFADLSGYAAEVMRASGLVRSPFHLELKLDERGPCLIEVGARLAGHGNALLCNELHGGALDLVDLAGHYYLFPDDYGPVPLDWSAYDSLATRYVHGIATRRNRILRVQGVATVEALPEFHCWVRKPEVGALVEPTIDSINMPWSLVLRGPTESSLSEAAARVRESLGWNESVGLATRVALRSKLLARRCQQALRVRALSVLHRDSVVDESDRSGVRRPLERFARVLDALTLKAQLARLDRHPIPPDHPHTPRDEALAADILTWAEEYLAQPHPNLGRKGPVCPFVQHTMDIGRFFVRVYSGPDGSSLSEMRRLILGEVARFREQYPREGSKVEFASLVLAFPDVPESRLGALDEVHGQLKTQLMRRDLMFSAFHAHSTKPSIANRGFHAFRSPVPLFAIRHMDVRDIAFIGHNREAFDRYRQRFAVLFEAGRVSNEFDHVTLYEQACARFGSGSSA